PIGFAGGINFYGYVGNNPVNYVDPRGLDHPYFYFSKEQREKFDQTIHGEGLFEGAGLPPIFSSSKGILALTAVGLYAMYTTRPENICPIGLPSKAGRIGLTAAEKTVLRKIGTFQEVAGKWKPGTRIGEIKRMVKYRDEMGRTRIVLHEIKDATGRIIHRDFAKPQGIFP
ncbi:MAG: hypothetical protein HYU64_21160, partial [Armatimonadetes bacterium]|nr:hypothetical protein [Armatimonadota bacterium]